MDHLPLRAGHIAALWGSCASHDEKVALSADNLTPVQLARRTFLESHAGALGGELPSARIQPLPHT